MFDRRISKWRANCFRSCWKNSQDFAVTEEGHSSSQESLVTCFDIWNWRPLRMTTKREQMNSMSLPVISLNVWRTCTWNDNFRHFWSQTSHRLSMGVAVRFMLRGHVLHLNITVKTPQHSYNPVASWLFAVEIEFTLLKQPTNRPGEEAMAFCLCPADQIAELEIVNCSLESTGLGFGVRCVLIHRTSVRLNAIRAQCREM